jgi:hypothetical protein
LYLGTIIDTFMQTRWVGIAGHGHGDRPAFISPTRYTPNHKKTPGEAAFPKNPIKADPKD